MDEYHAKFTIGQLVAHNRFGYRGVIVGVDATFQGTEEWYENVARSRPPRGKPWYHVLVHNGTHHTYVAERHLEADQTNQPINHPDVEIFFDRFDQGRYVNETHLN